MENKKKTQENTWLVMTASLVIGMLLGVVSGFTILPYMERNELPLWWFIGLLAVVYWLHILLHELGHMVCGLATGYRFLSFRIFRLTIVKEQGKLHLRLLHIPGTAGQCLMAPPTDSSRRPFLWYNLGGCILNLLTGLVALGLIFALPDIPLLRLFLACFALAGLFAGLSNGIPMQSNMTCNDGMNTLWMCRDPSCVYSLYTQLRVTEALTEGKRLKEMPEDWFVLPETDRPFNSLLIAVPVFAANRQMDLQNFSAAEAQIRALLEEDSLHPVHRNLLICDLITLLVLTDRQQEAESWLTKEHKKFMRSMKGYVSVVRTEYALTLRSNLGSLSREDCKKRFEQAAKVHPYVSDVESEREWMTLVETYVMP